MARVGTLAWGDDTGGVLRLRDRLDLVLVQGLPELARHGIEKLGWPRPLPAAELRPIYEDLDAQLPTGDLAREAEALCRRVSPPWLQNHCFRVYAFGLMLGVKHPKVDREKLFAMAMLHDLGLTEAYRRQPGEMDAPCFAVRGARAARPVAGDDVAKAVALHLNVWVPRRAGGIEAPLLQAGTNLDVAGIRYERLPPQAVEAVVERWPRGPWRWEAWRALDREVGAQPEYCRARFLQRWGMLRRRIAGAPFPD